VKTIVTLGLLLAAGCSKETDPCQRAIDRIARVNAQRNLPSSTREAEDEMLAACRKGGKSGYDPVLRCAKDSATDEAAAACIDRFLDAVLKIAPKKPGPPPGGLNPLLSQ
jgi:hypothetical protein